MVENHDLAWLRENLNPIETRQIAEQILGLTCSRESNRVLEDIVNPPSFFAPDSREYRLRFLFIERMLKLEDNSLNPVSFERLFKSGIIQEDLTIHCAYGAYLELAALNGHLEVVRILLKSGSCSEEGKRIALRSAAANGHLEVVRIMLDSKISEVYRADALRYAAANRHLEVVRILLDSGMSEDEKAGALRLAAANGHLEVVRILLDSGMSEGYRGDALSNAARYGHVEVVELLLGSEISERNVARALGEAANNGHLETVKLFLDLGFSESYYIHVALWNARFNGI